MSMNVRRFDRKGREEEVWREMETFIAVDDWWLDE
jgi:hypothetical protein